MGETAGRVRQTPGQMRMTVQPGLGNGIVWRKSGVDRKSEKVLAQNDRFASKTTGQHIASTCKGKPRAAFFSCLRREGKKLFGR